MSLNNDQKRAFKRQMSKLEEDGFFPALQRSVGKGTRYLIISYGGTGAAALFATKKKIEDCILDEELRSYVRFLAIDTDITTQKNTKEETFPDGTKNFVVLDELTSAQFFQLNPGSAKNDLEQQPEIFSDWINPDLPAKIKADQTFLDGKGASGTRQVGRITLYPTQTVQLLQQRINTLVGELTNRTADKLKIMILSGIAGGTGSGTVIDLTYLIRDIVNRMPGNIYGRTEFVGFILLPPTGTSTNPTEIFRGNKNGYAALKEINQFMTLATRGDVFRQQYGGRVVESREKLFKVCFLMDGVQNGVALGSDARSIVTNSLAECILDMMTSLPVDQTDPSNTGAQAIDSFTSDVPSFTHLMVSGKSASVAPRDVDYVYCTLGHGEMPIPINLMKAYVANRIFKEMKRAYDKCGHATDEDAKEFLEKITLPNGRFTRSAQSRAITTEADRLFQNARGGKGGPYYVINLMYRMSDAVQLEKDKSKLFRNGFASDEQLSFIANECLRINQETFEVYVAVMEEMRRVLEQESGIICTADKDAFGYSFSLISLGDTDGKSAIVRKYLDGLVSRQTTDKLTAELLREMIENKAAWTELFKSDKTSGAFDGVKAIRRFWTEKIDQIVSATLEDFLIKYYSGDETAHYDSEDPDASAPALKAAAAEIYDEMFGPAGKAHALIDYTSNQCLTPSDFNGHNYFMIPKDAPHLLQAVKDHAASVMNAADSVRVYSSYAKDRISCYAQYTSIPAFKLAWVCSAEQAYEDALSQADAGLHMSESPSGQLWREFPNLLPKSTWKLVPKPSYENPREAIIADRAQQMFDEAKKLDLTSSRYIDGGSEYQEYKIKLLPERFRPPVEPYRILDVTGNGTRERNECLEVIKAYAKKSAFELFTKVQNWEKYASVVDGLKAAGVVFTEKLLKDTVTEISSGNSAKPEGWDEYIAACMLRRTPDTMNALRGTLAVMNELRAIVEAHNRTKSLVSSFAKYLSAGLFTYNEEYYQWEYITEDDIEQDICQLEPDDEVEKAAEYYFLFNSLAEHEDIESILETLDAQYKEASEDSDRAAKIRKKRELKEKAAELKNKLNSTISDKTNRNKPGSTATDKTNRSRLSMIGTVEWQSIAEQRGYDVSAIREFYKKLINELEVLYPAV